MYLFSPKNVLEGAKIMYVNNVLENQIWDVPLLQKESENVKISYCSRHIVGFMFFIGSVIFGIFEI